MTNPAASSRTDGWATLAALAAGTAAGIVAERLWSRRQLAEVDVPPDPVIAHGTALMRVVTDDDAILHARVDTPADWQPGDPTVVLVHGFALDLTTWDHQRRALLSVARVVSYDHRGHGRSQQDEPGPDELTIDRLARDLACVLDACVGEDRVILAGHSMGGMTIMSLAEHHPDWFATRIVGIALLGTTAGAIPSVTLGLPTPVAALAHRLTPLVGTIAGNEALSNLVMRIRDSGSDLSRILTRTYAFGQTAPEHGTALVAHLLATTPLSVAGDLLRDIARHDRFDALTVCARVPTLIIVGDADQLTPSSHSRRINETMTGSTLIILDGVGHMLTLEAPDAVSAALVEFTRDVFAASQPTTKRAAS